MQTLIAASFANKVHTCPTWLKSVARVTVTFVVIKGSVALAAAWLAFRGFENL